MAVQRKVTAILGMCLKCLILLLRHGRQCQLRQFHEYIIKLCFFSPTGECRLLEARLLGVTGNSASRLSISGAPTVGGYGGSITITTSNPSSIARASLVKCPHTTHHYDSNIRYVWLGVTGRTSISITVLAPLNANLAPRSVLLHPYHKQLWYCITCMDSQNSCMT
jgi:hypothetical protein